GSLVGAHGDPAAPPAGAPRAPARLPAASGLGPPAAGAGGGAPALRRGGSARPQGRQLAPAGRAAGVGGTGAGPGGRLPEQAVRRAQYFRELALAPAAAKEVRLFGTAAWIAGQVRQAWQEGVAGERTGQQRAFAMTLAASVAVMAANALVYGLLAADAATHV